MEETTQAVDTGPAQAEERAVEEEGGAQDAPHEEQQREREAEQASRIGELEAALSDGEQRLSGLDGLLGQRDARIGELEAALGQVEGVVKEREQEAEGLRAQLAQAVELYRASLLAAAPDIPEELVNGATIAEVEASLAQARQMVEQVRGQLEAQAVQERVPFGAPARSAPDLSALSSQEKIRLGLDRR